MAALETVQRAPMATRTFAPLPVPDSVDGPRTRRLQLRLVVILAMVCGAGLILDIVAPSPRWTAFGLGLVLPGGGFAFAGAWGLVVAGALAFVLALLIFAVMSPFWVPPLVWLALSAGAGLQVGGSHVEAARWVVPIALAAVAGGVLASRPLKLRRLRAEVASRNAFLAARRWAEPVAATPGADVAPLSDDELASLRRSFDLMLQPVDSFDGFLTRDQYREAAWRYQINFVAWNLAMCRMVRTPAFSGYLVEAQRNAVAKMLDPRIWRYWRWEHMLGSLRWDPDPIKTDNIMLSGYFAAQVGAYETASGDLSFTEPGALTFDDGRRRYVYDFGSISRCVRDNFAAGPLCMFPCEPNWVYPQCNEVGMIGLLFYDRLHGGDLAASVWDEFVASAREDLARPDDRVVTLRSNRYGVVIPTMEVGIMSDAGSAFWMSPILPEVAARRWELARRDYLRVDADGGLELRGAGRIDRVDPGNYHLNSGAFCWASMMIAAREMGDEEIYQAALLSLERECEPYIQDGARHLRKASPMAQGTATLGRMMGRHSWHDMVRVGLPDSAHLGPRLEQAPYPDALVALAVSDGRDLELELVPGNGGGAVELVLAGLAPGGEYAVAGGRGDNVVASSTGTAAISVNLEDRRRVRVTPR